MCVTTQHYWRDSALPFVELRSTYDSVQSYKPHFHDEFSFGAVISGQTRANCRGREHVLLQGDLVLIAPHAVHSCNPVAAQPRSYHMLYVNEAWCLDVMASRKRSLVHDCTVLRDARLFEQYLKCVSALPDLSASAAAAELQRLLTIAVGSDPRAAHPAKLEPLAERIKKALLDSITTGATLDDLAHSFGCRKETLIRVFRRAFHITPHAFLNNARVEQAKQRLKHGEAIVNVAAELGFCDQAQLHRTFVSYTASTPGQYRRAQSVAKINFRQ